MAGLRKSGAWRWVGEERDLGSVWLGGWKGKRIENRGRIEKSLVFLICVWLRWWKSRGMKTFWFC